MILFLLLIALFTNCRIVGGKQISYTPRAVVNVSTNASDNSNKLHSTKVTLADNPPLTVDKKNSTENSIVVSSTVPVTDPSICKNNNKDTQEKVSQNVNMEIGADQKLCVNSINGPLCLSERIIRQSSGSIIDKINVFLYALAKRQSNPNTLDGWQGKQIVEGFNANTNSDNAYLPPINDMPNRSIRDASIEGYDAFIQNIGPRYGNEWGNNLQSGCVWLGNNLIGLAQNPEYNRLTSNYNTKQSIVFNPNAQKTGTTNNDNQGILEMSLQNSNISDKYGFLNSANRQLQNIKDMCVNNIQQQNMVAGYKIINPMPQIPIVDSLFTTIKNGYQQPNVNIRYTITSGSKNEPCNTLDVSTLNQNLENGFNIQAKQNIGVNNIGIYETPNKNHNNIVFHQHTGVKTIPDMFNVEYGSVSGLNQQIVGIKNNLLGLRANNEQNYYAQLNDMAFPYENTRSQNGANPYYFSHLYRPKKFSPLIFNRVNILSSNVSPQFKYSNPLLTSFKTR